MCQLNVVKRSCQAQLFSRVRPWRRLCSLHSAVWPARRFSFENEPGRNQIECGLFPLWDKLSIQEGHGRFCENQGVQLLQSHIATHSSLGPPFSKKKKRYRPWLPPVDFFPWWKSKASCVCYPEGRLAPEWAWTVIFEIEILQVHD